MPRSYFDISGEREAHVLESGPCVPGPETLCLHDDRFEVVIERDGSHQPAVPLTPRSGAFWFFHPTNLEVVVKIVDGTNVNGSFWVFYGALTNHDYSVIVTDTLTGDRVRYDNPFGNYCGIGDTEPF